MIVQVSKKIEQKLNEVKEYNIGENEKKVVWNLLDFCRCAVLFPLMIYLKISHEHLNSFSVLRGIDLLLYFTGLAVSMEIAIFTFLHRK